MSPRMLMSSALQGAEEAVVKVVSAIGAFVLVDGDIGRGHILGQR